ncbi:MAG: hypothetical protein ABL983_25395, partial [Nitrospira sp.]
PIGWGLKRKALLKRSSFGVTLPECGRVLVRTRTARRFGLFFVDLEGIGQPPILGLESRPSKSVDAHHEKQLSLLVR